MGQQPLLSIFGSKKGIPRQTTKENNTVKLKFLNGIPPVKEVRATRWFIQVNPLTMWTIRGNCDNNPKIRNRNQKLALQHHTGITCDNRED